MDSNTSPRVDQSPHPDNQDTPRSSGAHEPGSSGSGSSPACAGAPAAARGEMQRLTHSRLACFRTCPRKHYLRYELGLRPEETSQALRVGSAFHAALEADDNGDDPATVIADSLTCEYDVALVMAMFARHRARYTEDSLKPVAAELPFDLPLANPATGRATSVWRLAGVIDRIVELPDGRTALMEYKTTSRDISPGSDYWLRLHMDPQLSIYVLAARALGYEIDTILYDVTRRPMLKPLKATPEDKRKYNKKTGELYRGQREEDEAPVEFLGRVAMDIDSRPDHYFARIEIARLEADLKACANEIWQQQLAIRNSQNAGHFWRNPGACFQPFSCEYLPICQHSDLDHSTPIGFVRCTDIHPELSRDASLAS